MASLRKCLESLHRQASDASIRMLEPGSQYLDGLLVVSTSRLRGGLGRSHHLLKWHVLLEVCKQTREWREGIGQSRFLGRHALLNTALQIIYTLVLGSKHADS